MVTGKIVYTTSPILACRSDWKGLTISLSMMTQCVTCIVLFVGLIGSVHCQTPTVDTPTTRQTDISTPDNRGTTAQDIVSTGTTVSQDISTSDNRGTTAQDIVSTGTTISQDISTSDNRGTTAQEIVSTGTTISQDESIYSERHVEYAGYDGWYNNRAHPEWGAVEMPLTRRLPSAYKDGVYMPIDDERPNPLTISEETMKGPTGKGSLLNRTALMVFFGQQVVEEILDAQRPGCPPEYYNIEVPDDHPLYEKGYRVMPFVRSRYDMGNTGFSPNNPRQQLNEITPYIDGGLMYGTSKAWADALRSFEGGRLAKSEIGNFPAENDIGLPMANPPAPADHKLKDAKRFFKLGNPRGNENPFLLTFGILWFRWHNYLADDIAAKHPSWSDERIFNEARKWVIATHQKIVLYDWLPAFLNLNESRVTELRDNYAYSSAIHPGVTHVFQSAAMRIGHTLVPPGVFRRNSSCDFRKTTIKSNLVPNYQGGHEGVRTCNSFWNPQLPILETDIDEFLMGMASQICEREDNIITEDLRGKVFGPLEFSRRDLMALNIQRGRDHGLPDYNTARREYNLAERENFRDINPNLPDDIVERLAKVHDDDITKLDIWTGGLMETDINGPGELFHTIILDQFIRIRDGDRFWYENRKNNLFTEQEIAEINSITLYDIIVKTSSSISEDDIQKDVFHHYAGDKCEQPYQLNQTDMEECTEIETFDYFSGSEASFILTFFASGLFAIGCILLLFFLGRKKDAAMKTIRAGDRKKHANKMDSDERIFITNEWRGKERERAIKVKLGPGRQMSVLSDFGRVLRMVEFTDAVKTIDMQVAPDKGRKMMLIRVEKEYDLVMKFRNQNDRDNFIKEFQEFLGASEVGIGSKRKEIKQDLMLKHAVTKAHRQQVLERFFRVAFAQAFNIAVSKEKLNSDEAKEVLTCELTKAEFAEAMSLKSNSLFVEKMFDLIDKDQNGYVNFREFLDMLVIFSKGSPEDRLKLFFDMYDLDGSGRMTREEFKKMIKSFLDIVSASVEMEKLDELVDSMFAEVGFQNKQDLTFDDFDRIMTSSGHKDELAVASLNFAGPAANLAVAEAQQQQQQQIGRGKTVIKRENAPQRARKTIIRAYSHPGEEERAQKQRKSNKSIRIETKKKEISTNPAIKKFNAFKRYIENYRMHIFWMTLYLLVLLGIFIERAYYYSVEREHAGLRRIAGYGVTVTRGAASAQMFTYSTLLVTMCRNTITFLRDTVLNRYIPFDSAITFHKVVAMLALFFTLLHTIGHSINFYHISSQPANDLTCYFREFKHLSHELPKFHYWCWETITGLTGVALLLLVFIMYVFATQYARRHVFTWFWNTHQLYVLLYLLMILHGCGRLVQFPIFYLFFVGPAVLFTFDKLISISRKKSEIAVVKAELLPSEVTSLVFKRPIGFEYKSGQWVRIACIVLGDNEYHPFTLTSAPHEEHLMLHIRAVGPWTTNIRQTYDPNVVRDHPFPKLFLDGPFGEGHQDWSRYEVSVLVGGGIGVTPFASILKDIVNKSKLNATFTCKKVYFIWVTRTQKHYEWLTDIIREVEENDIKDMVSVHIFITQFYQRFDLRTTMLYICERHFQKISNRSLFTGLRSITHFGRPTFNSFLDSLQQEHPGVSKIGVFSCGPPTMTRGVEKACSALNKVDGAAFIHHYENF